MDDKMYVITRYDWIDGDWESDSHTNVAVAMSPEAATRFIENWKDPEGILVPDEGEYTEADGKAHRWFHSEDYEHMHLTFDVLPLV